MNYSMIIRCYKRGPIDFRLLASDADTACVAERSSGRCRRGSATIGSELISIDTASRAIAGSWNEPVSSRLYQIARPSPIPVEDLEAVTASIDEQEQVTGRGILGKGGGHQAGQRIEAFAEIGGRSVEEHSDGMREADHREPPESVLARATARMRRQAKCVVSRLGCEGGFHWEGRPRSGLVVSIARGGVR